MRKLNRAALWVLLPSLPLLAGCPGPTEADVCKGRAAGDLVITEIMSDPDGTDTGQEYVELYNNLGTPIDLKGFTITVRKPDGTGLKSHLIRAGQVPARGYFTLGDVRVGTALPPHIGYSYEDDLGGLPQTDGVLAIKCKALVIDEASYGQTKAGHAWTLNGDLPPDHKANDEAINWCDAPDVFSGANYGSPAAPNPACPLVVAPGNCLDNGLPRPIVPPDPSQVLITEVMADPRLYPDQDGEWFEVRFQGGADLNGLVLSTATSKSTVASVDCLPVPANGYAVFTASPDAGVQSNGVFNFSLSNGGGTISVGSPDASYDSLTYAPAVNGVSWQLDPTKLDTFSNDDPANQCRATEPAFPGLDGGDLGTPGLPNSACPTVVDPSTCVDQGTGTSRQSVKPVLGDLVITEWMANPENVADTSGEWVELVVKSEVDLNGVVVAAGTGTLTVNSPTCLRLPTGTHALVARNPNSATNGGLPQVLPAVASGSFTLANSTGTITVSTDAGVLDTVAWSVTQGTGISTNLDVNQYDPAQNDIAANLCRATDAGTYGTLADGGVGTDRGTPGALNIACQ